MMRVFMQVLSCLQDVLSTMLFQKSEYFDIQGKEGKA